MNRMTGANKILTVSYGTFSCTLEGFDEPFDTMKAIAEYFRDLAADDRFFGAEPPVPDAEMLARIAEAQTTRQVEARVRDNGVDLRLGPATGAGPAPSPEPSPAPAAAETRRAPRPAPVPGEAPEEPLSAEVVESVAAKLQRIRAAVAVSRAAAAAPVTFAEEPEPAPVRAAGTAATGLAAATAAEGALARAFDEDAAETAAEPEDGTTGPQAAAGSTEAEAAEAPAAEDEAAPEPAEPEAAEAPAAAMDTAGEAEEDAEPVTAEPETLDTAAPAEPDAEPVAEVEPAAEPEATEAVAESMITAPEDAAAIEAEAEPAAEDETAGEPAEVEPAEAMDTAAEAETEAEPEADAVTTELADLEPEAADADAADDAAGEPLTAEAETLDAVAETGAEPVAEDETAAEPAGPEAAEAVPEAIDTAPEDADATEAAEEPDAQEGIDADAVAEAATEAEAAGEPDTAEPADLEPETVAAVTLAEAEPEPVAEEGPFGEPVEPGAAEAAAEDIDTDAEAEAATEAEAEAEPVTAEPADLEPETVDTLAAREEPAEPGAATPETPAAATDEAGDSVPAGGIDTEVEAILARIVALKADVSARAAGAEPVAEPAEPDVIWPADTAGAAEAGPVEAVAEDAAAGEPETETAPDEAPEALADEIAISGEAEPAEQATAEDADTPEGPRLTASAWDEGAETWQSQGDSWGEILIEPEPDEFLIDLPEDPSIGERAADRSAETDAAKAAEAAPGDGDDAEMPAAGTARTATADAAELAGPEADAPRTEDEAEAEDGQQAADDLPEPVLFDATPVRPMTLLQRARARFFGGLGRSRTAVSARPDQPQDAGEPLPVLVLGPEQAAGRDDEPEATADGDVLGGDPEALRIAAEAAVAVASAEDRAERAAEDTAEDTGTDATGDNGGAGEPGGPRPAQAADGDGPDDEGYRTGSDSDDAAGDDDSPFGRRAEDAEIDRIDDMTTSEMSEAETRRRQSAISHLKAAVAAAEAERSDSGSLPAPLPPASDAPFREDLSQAIRPRRPVITGAADETGPGTDETATDPLVLGLAQRVDRPRPEPAVQPRRVSTRNMLRDDFDPEEEDFDDTTPSSAEAMEASRDFAEFAEKLGANNLPELLEAAAAYTSAIEGHTYFSRPQILQKVARIADESDFSREESLRSFGMLLRQGKIQKIRRGQFVIASTSKFMADARRARL